MLPGTHPPLGGQGGKNKRMLSTLEAQSTEHRAQVTEKNLAPLGGVGGERRRKKGKKCRTL